MQNVLWTLLLAGLLVGAYSTEETQAQPGTTQQEPASGETKLFNTDVIDPILFVTDPELVQAIVKSVANDVQQMISPNQDAGQSIEDIVRAIVQKTLQNLAVVFTQKHIPDPSSIDSGPAAAAAVTSNNKMDPAPPASDDNIAPPFPNPVPDHHPIHVLNDQERCNLTAFTGRCRGYKPRYVYDAEKKTCQEFIFGGCPPDKDQFFLSKEDCETACVP